MEVMGREFACFEGIHTFWSDGNWCTIRDIHELRIAWIAARAQSERQDRNSEQDIRGSFPILLKLGLTVVPVYLRGKVE